jgi:hypothetical protein
MSEIDAINERLRRGEERFSELTDALSRITTHLQSQDQTMADVVGKLDKVVKGTDSIVVMWNGGVQAVQLFCRLADAWRFLMKQVFLPFGLPVMGLYGLWYYTEFHRFPPWLADAFKFLMAVL